MKATPLTSISPVGRAPHASVAYLRSAAPLVSVGTASLQLEQALGQLEELQRALASSQQDSIAARQQIVLLTAIIAQQSESAAQREQDLDQARYLAHHDKLTGLPNRILLEDRLNQALARAQRRLKPLALLLLDLDGFKAINDRLGHAVGDELLQRVAERLLSCIRGGDTACRYGGDEFVLLLPEVNDRRHALEVAQKIRARMARPYGVDGCSVVVPASIGVAVSPIDGVSQRDLIREADLAMYSAKTLSGASTNTHTEAAASG